MSPLNRKLNRREALGTLGAAGVAFAVGCGSSPTSPTTTSSRTDGTVGTPTGETSTAASCTITPEETAGPYPDKAGMIGNQAYFRRDITGGRPGLPLTL